MEPKAKNTLPSRYLNELFRYAMVLTRNQADAEDLVQETYVRALNAVENLKPDSNVKSWLFTILRNAWLNQLRRTRSAPRMVELDTDEGSADLAVETGRDPHALYVEAQERDLVRDAIQQLPVEFREIIVLREYDELSYEDIAGLLDCPPGTVMSRLARARAKLRALLSAVWRPENSEREGKRSFSPVRTQRLRLLESE